MFSSLFSNPSYIHLAEILFWMFGSFLIGLFFGRIKKNKENNKVSYNLLEYEDLNIQDDLSKIRATKTFERGGREMIKTPSIKVHENALNFQRIGKASIHDKNNLQEIIGIDTSIEEELNTIGIFTFEQIANCNNNDSTKIAELINLPPGEIERDNWVGQAKDLLCICEK